MNEYVRLTSPAGFDTLEDRGKDVIPYPILRQSLEARRAGLQQDIRAPVKSNVARPTRLKLSRVYNVQRIRNLLVV